MRKPWNDQRLRASDDAKRDKRGQNLLRQVRVEEGTKVKMTPQMQAAQENMRPGIISSQGFLGGDDRPLVDIITEDEERVASTGKSIEEIAQRMEYFLVKGQAGLGEMIQVDADWEVRVDEARGKMVCPFQDGVFSKVNVQVCKISAAACITYSLLSMHLIQLHHFFQGQGSTYRVDPEDLARILFE